jgi:hypothetical protein
MESTTMKPTKRNITRLFEIVNRSLFRINSTLDYARTMQAIIELGELISDHPGDSLDLWSIGEFGETSLDSLIVGAFWFCSDYHGGQDSIEYKCLSVLGDIFAPGFADGPEPESSEADVYSQLEAMIKHQGQTDLCNAYSDHLTRQAREATNHA